MSTEYHHSTGDGYVTETVDTGTQTAAITGHIPYHHLQVSGDDGQLINDGTDTERITVEVVDGLQVARGETPAVLSYDGDVTLEIDGGETVKSVSAGTASFDITTSKAAGSVISVRGVELSDHPADSDAVSIEVTQ
jgi:hypothetical protein